MAALPCPPMPLMIMTQEEEEDETIAHATTSSTKTYCNSHDFIASLLVMAMSHGDQKLNEERKAKQIELTKNLLHQMTTLAQDDDVKDNKNLIVEKAYSYFSEFTAGYICAFANINVGVTFLPWMDVNPQDKVHKACYSWIQAQSILYDHDDNIVISTSDNDSSKDCGIHKYTNTNANANANTNNKRMNQSCKKETNIKDYKELLFQHCNRFLQDANDKKKSP